MQTEVIDFAFGVELVNTPDGPIVAFEDDERGGSSLLFAYHEGQIFCGQEHTEIDLDPAQYEQIEAWFMEYEA